MNIFKIELIKNALILCGITLAAGILLGAVYEITKKPRERQQELTEQKAYKEVMGEAEKFSELNVDKALSAKIEKALSDNGITEKNVVIDRIVKAEDKEQTAVGYIILVTSKEGYGGNISFTVGVDMNAQVTGISILSIGETAGLGMNAKEESFLSRYKAEGEGLFIVNKPDGTEGINIDAISGATITSKAMTKGVNAAKLTAAILLGGAGEEKATDESGTAPSDTEGSSEDNGGENVPESTEGGEADA